MKTETINKIIDRLQRVANDVHSNWDSNDAERDGLFKAACDIAEIVESNETLVEETAKCDVLFCEESVTNGGCCWRETGYWSTCDKHLYEFTSGASQPPMKQAAIDRENSRRPDGTLPPKP